MKKLVIAGSVAVTVGIAAAGTALAQAETVESAPTDSVSSASDQGGQVYTYADGDRTVRVVLQPDLEVSGDSSNGGSGAEHIVTKNSARMGSGQPVFRSESSGNLMTLPGGVLLVLEAEWSEAQTQAFFARNRIALRRVSALAVAPNSFFVETAPGFPSLDLANTLADQEGVRISSPNWQREVAKQ